MLTIYGRDDAGDWYNVGSAGCIGEARYILDRIADDETAEDVLTIVTRHRDGMTIRSGSDWVRFYILPAFTLN